MKFKHTEREYWLYEHRHDSIQTLLSHVASIAKGRKVNIALFSAKSDILEVIKHAPKGFNIQVDYDEPIFRVDVSYHKKEKGHLLSKDIRALCVKMDYPHLYMVLSDYKPALFKTLILRLIRFNYPLLSRVFLRNSEIYDLISAFNKEERLQTVVRKVLFYSRVPDVGKQFQDKDLKWTNKSFDEIYDDILEQNGWIRKIDSVSFPKKILEDSYFSGEPGYFETSVSSDCHFIVKGDFLIFYSHFIAPSMKLVSKRLGYLQERSEKAGNKLPEPMVIKFPEAVFIGENWHEKFLETMEKMKNLSISQLHGNPYIHLSLLDYQDGSSFTVWIVSEDEIYIIPQVRASVASMTRILAYIFEKIREGDMIQYVPSEAT